MDNYMLHVQESVNLTIYLYAQTMGQPRMLYIRKLYINDERDTGNVRLAITINKAQGQSLV